MTTVDHTLMQGSKPHDRSGRRGVDWRASAPGSGANTVSPRVPPTRLELGLGAE
jgi:hypothetical protein